VDPENSYRPAKTKSLIGGKWVEPPRRAPGPHRGEDPATRDGSPVPRYGAEELDDP